MPLASFGDLFQHADALPCPVSVAVVGAADATVLEAVRAACKRRWIRPILMGRDPDIRQIAAEQQVSLDGLSIIDSDEPAAAAVAEVHAGRAQLLMKGQIATPALMRWMA